MDRTSSKPDALDNLAKAFGQLLGRHRRENDERFKGLEARITALEAKGDKA